MAESKDNRYGNNYKNTRGSSSGSSTRSSSGSSTRSSSGSSTRSSTGSSTRSSSGSRSTHSSAGSHSTHSSSGSHSTHSSTGSRSTHSSTGSRSTHSSTGSHSTHSSTGSHSTHSRYSPARRRKRRRRRRLNINWTPIILLIAVVAVVCVVVVLLFWRIGSRSSLELVGEQTVTIAVGDDYVDEGVIATYRDKDASENVYETNNVVTTEVGTYEVTYTLEEGRRSKSVTRHVVVEDLNGPVIRLNGNATMAADSYETFEDPGVTAVDDVDGDVSDRVSVKVDQLEDGTIQVVYSVADSAGNESSEVRRLVPYDETSPEITLNGEETITMDANQPFEDPGATAYDNLDGDITDTITEVGWVDIYRPDTYTLTYTATDSSGNQASVSRTVVVESVPSTDPGSIYLTFDDGPSWEVTPRILDILDANDIKATFFIIDYTEDELPLIERMLEEGHTVGIHSYAHEYSIVYQSVDAFMEDIDKLWTKLYNDTGYEATWMRFPGGSVNTQSSYYCVGIMTALVQLVSEEGWKYMDWNVSGGDAEAVYVDADTIIQNVEEELEPDRKNVVLLHDLETDSTTADALQTIIDYGKANGYTFKKIEEDTVPVHQPVYN